MPRTKSAAAVEPIVAEDEAAFFAQLERDGVIAEVNNYSTLFMNTRDGRFFLKAFLTLHEAGEPIPQNFLDLLAHWADRLLAAKSDKELAQAIEFRGDEKSKKGASFGVTYQRRWRIASEVERVKQLFEPQGMTLTRAIEVVANAQGLSIANVKAMHDKIFRAPGRKAAKARKPGAMDALAQVWRS